MHKTNKGRLTTKSQGVAMRILQVVHGFPPRQRTGTETLTYNLSKELAKRHEVHVLYPVYEKSWNARINSYRREGLHIHELVIPSPSLWRLIRLEPYKLSYRNIEAEKKFEELLLQIKPTLVHFQHLIGLSVYLPLIAKKWAPVVITLNDYWFVCPTTHFLKYNGEICRGFSPKDCSICLLRSVEEYAKWYLKRIRVYDLPPLLKPLEDVYASRLEKKIIKRALVVKRIIRIADKIIAPSETIVKKLIENGFLSDEDLRSKIVILHHGVDVNNLRDIKRTISDKIRFGYVGGISERKGVHVLIDAFRKLGNINAELRIYGHFDPINNEYHRALAWKSKDIPNIKFMGPFNDVREPYSNIDVLVVPSITYEGYSLVVQEAFAAKIPVIASDIGALNEFVKHMVNGLLFRVNDPEDLAEKMRIIVESPTLLKQLIDGIPIPKSVGDYATEIEKIYETVVRDVGSHVKNVFKERGL
jgi:glycosyltransferase involved in cell wall biosynthesis